MKEHPYDRYDPWRYAALTMEMMKSYQDIIDKDYKESIEKTIERMNYISKYAGYELLIPEGTSSIFNFAIKILEKENKRKPIPETGFIRYACPACKSIVYQDYCGTCGQALDWSIE